MQWARDARTGVPLLTVDLRDAEHGRPHRDRDQRDHGGRARVDRRADGASVRRRAVSAEAVARARREARLRSPATTRAGARDDRAGRARIGQRAPIRIRRRDRSALHPDRTRRSSHRRPLHSPLTTSGPPNSTRQLCFNPRAGHDLCDPCRPRVARVHRRSTKREIVERVAANARLLRDAYGSTQAQAWGGTSRPVGPPPR